MNERKISREHQGANEAKNQAAALLSDHCKKTATSEIGSRILEFQSFPETFGPLTIVCAYRERVDYGCFECLVHFNHIGYDKLTIGTTIESGP
jgi:hypothetical protein